MRRFSIRTLMTYLLVPAAGLAVLRNSNAWWAGTMLFVAIAVLGISMVGAVIMRGRERSWWAGFSFFCGSYLVLTFAPGFSTEVMPRLVTTKLLEVMHSEFAYSSTQARLPQILWWQHERALGIVNRLRADNRKPGDRELDSAIRILVNLESQLQGAADQRDFIRVGHTLFGLLAGLVGGTVAVWFHSRRDRLFVEDKGA